MRDYSCTPNCDTDSTYIDMHQRAVSEQQKRKTEQKEERKKAHDANNGLVSCVGEWNPETKEVCLD